MFKVDHLKLEKTQRFKNIDPKTRENLVLAETNSYCQVLNEYVAILSELINSFQGISETARDWKTSQVEFIENMKKFYEYNECDVGEVQLVLGLYHTFLKIFSELGDKLVFSVNNIKQL